ATTRRSAPVPRSGTRPLAVSAAWGTPFGWPAQHPASTLGATGSHVPCGCLTGARATFTPVTTWPVSRHPPGSSRGNDWTPVLMTPLRFRRFSSGSLTFAFPARTCRISCAFSATLTTTALNRSSLRWFETSPCRAVPEGHTSITSTAPHPKITILLHRNLHQRSWCPMGGIRGVARPPVPRIVGVPAGQAALLLAQLPHRGTVAALAGTARCIDDFPVCGVGFPCPATGIFRYQN